MILVDPFQARIFCDSVDPSPSPSLSSAANAAPVRTPLTQREPRRPQSSSCDRAFLRLAGGSEVQQTLDFYQRQRDGEKPLSPLTEKVYIYI